MGMKYLKAIEEGKLEELPAGVYRRNFVKEYADFLGYDSRDLLENFNESQAEKEKKDIFSCQVAKTKTIVIPNILKGIFIAGVVAVCLFYLQSRYSNVVSPPNLVINNPSGDLKTSVRELNIIGSTDPETQVTINDNMVLLDGSGSFSQLINLREGINTITITAKKKFGPEKKIVKQILVKSN
ncbi:MAG: helix-turn-helix domain-containing protein [Patescibacteria group bacterium]